MPSEQGNVWDVRMLGGFEVVGRHGEQPKFRSKSCRSLFAYLLLNPGKQISRFVLEEMFWPESDANRQAQNLRRAISDLREALETDTDRGEVIATMRDVVQCRTDRIETDTARFLALSETGLKNSDEDDLLEALSMYRGPLLGSFEYEWVYPYRLEFEESFGQIVERFCTNRFESGHVKEAVRVARSALLLAPNREDIHVALIRSYRLAGMESEALRQYEDLERMMDDNWGEPPSIAARAALEGKPSAISAELQIGPVSRTISVESESSGGAMSVTSPYYVRRPADAQAEACLSRNESVILVQGPRQVGKSSLLARSLARAREQGCATVLNDFQTFGESQLVDEERFYKAVAHSLAGQLKLDIDLAALWSTWLGPNMNLDLVVGKVLERVDGHVCWAIDEADRLFGRRYVSDFFGLLRSWHNRRALDPGGPWGKLTLVLAYATEAHLFISDLNQSPFNVGVRLPLRDFSRSEVAELANHYAITSSEAINSAYQTTNGHPFLARRALAFLSQGGTPSDLAATCTLPDGPFGDHLQGLLGVILQHSDMVEDVKKIESGEPFSKPTTRYRLMAAGILAMTPDSERRFRVPAYGPYLAATLD